MQPFFSIIIPTLNEEKFIPQLLNDLSTQSYRDFEVIVVDGRSKDETRTVVKKIKSLPKLGVYTSKRRHVSVQRNVGATKATGEYLIFMDADNRIPKYYLEGVHYRILMDLPDIFTTWCTSPNDKPMSKSITLAFNLLIEASKSIEFENAFGALIGFRRSVFVQGRGFNEKIQYAEDSECVRRYVSLGYKFSIFHDPQYVYSLRRYQANGTINTLQKNARLYIRQVTGNRVSRKEYPMGGHVFIKSKKSLKTAIEEIQSKIRNLIEV